MEMKSTHSSGFSGGRRRPRAWKIVGLGILGLCAAAGFAFVFGLLVKVLWNALMPAIFGLSVITFWQAFGLVILAKILFGSHHGMHMHRRRRGGRRWAGFAGRRCWSEEGDATGEPMPGNGKRWGAFREYWHEEGKAAFEAYMQRMEDAQKGK